MNGTGNQYLLDTNIFIYYFNGHATIQPLFNEILAGDANGFYCPVSWIELLCYPALTESEADQIRSFLRSLTEVSLPELVLDRTANIRRKYRVSLADALIAACAIQIDSILVTRNVQDFQNIENLNLINPFTS
jgi:predicted nucleic acid-binding protein